MNSHHHECINKHLRGEEEIKEKKENEEDLNYDMIAHYLLFMIGYDELPENFCGTSDNVAAGIRMEYDDRLWISLCKRPLP